MSNRTPSLRIMVVDDDADILFALGSCLELDGFEVATASDGLRALEIAASFRPHVVISDLEMPRMGGLELARQLRLSDPAHLLVLLAMSGRREPHVHTSALTAGFDDFLPKPFEPSFIQARLERLHLRDRHEK